jgi:hypothetical protein
VKRPLKAGAVVLGIVGLLVVIALATGGGHPSTGKVVPRAVPSSVQDDFVTVLAVAYVLTIVVVVVMMFGRRPWHAPESHWLRNIVTTGVAMLLLTGIGYWALQHRPGPGNGNARPSTPGQPVIRPRTLPATSSDEEARRAHFDWPLALALGGLVGLVTAGFFLQGRLGERGRPQEEEVSEQLADVIETTIEDLRSERDARKAVIAAYAQMERVLTTAGLPRKQTETQLEYMTRILTELEVEAAAVRKLTELFGYAKFSRHEIDEEMRSEAIEALSAVQRDLRLGERVPA